MVKCRITYLNFESLKLLYYCHQDTKTPKPTKVKLLILVGFGDLEIWWHYFLFYYFSKSIECGK